MILVTGGTGLVGSHLLFRLVQNGNLVRAVHRQNSDLSHVKKIFSYYSEDAQAVFDKIDWVVADINDIPALEKAFIGVTQVYHCAALISFDPKDYRALKKANVSGTANIVNLSLAQSVAKLCYVSTIGTIGRSLQGTKANEETEWTETDANVYALTKYRAEMEVWRGSQEGLKVVIVNPGVIIGPTNWNKGSGILFSTAYKGNNFYPPGGTGFVTVDDVIKLMTRLMDSSIENERYIAVSQNLSYGEVMTKITAALEKKPPRKQLKFWQLELFRFVDFVRCKLTGRKRKLTKNSIRSLKNRQFFDNEKAMRDLNFEFEDLSGTIQLTAQHFLKEQP